jgi:hypothetical protein
VTVFRKVFAAMVVLGSLTVSPAAATPASADLLVEVDAMGHVVVPAALYTISLTNNGPQPVTSATVVVQLDTRAGGVFNPPPCPYDAVADTLTCSFGPIAVGATATKHTSFVVYALTPPTQVTATATLVSSTPADPAPANDSASATCDYRANTGLPPVPFRMFC